MEPLDAPWRLAMLVAGVAALFVLLGWRWMVILGGIVMAIFLHELGHFLAARRADMLATQFFIGVGPRIWSIRRGETEFGVKAIPFAAFVRVAGMTNLEAVGPGEEPRTYRQQTFGARLLLAVAGSAMHFMQAFIMLVLLHGLAGVPDVDNWRVGLVAGGSPASASELAPEDRIVAIGGTPVGEFESLSELVGPLAGEPVEVTYQRGTEELDTEVVIGDRLIEPVEGGAAQDLGLEPGDRILSVNGTEVTSFAQADEVLARDDAGAGPIELSIGRLGQECTLSGRTESSLAAENTSGFLGVGPTYPRSTTDPARAVARGGEDFLRVGWSSITSLGRFFSPSGLANFFERVVTTGPGDGEADAPEPTGAEECTSAGDTVGSADEGRVVSLVGAARLGANFEELGEVLEFFALLNIFIGVFNLIPLLPFDGGHVAVAVYERLRTRRGETQRHMVDMARLLPVTYVVVMVLMVVGFGALYLDLVDPVG